MAANINSDSSVSVAEEDRHSTKCNPIPWYLLPVMLTFFFMYGTLGSTMPYYNVFLTSVGLTANQAGSITGIRTIATIVFGPFWGLLADYTGQRKLIFIVLILGTVILLFPQPWIADHFNNIPLANNSVLLQTNRNETNRTSTINESIQSADKQNLYLAMLLSFFVPAIFDQPLLGYFDSIAMNVITTKNSKFSFGFLRMFGSIGFGLFNFISGISADNYHHSTLSSYTAIFFVLLCTGFLILPFAILTLRQTVWIVQDPEENDNGSNSNASESIIKMAIKTCVKCSNLVFLCTALVMGIGFGMNFGFTFLLMEDYMKSPKYIMGLTIVVSSIAEILLFPISWKIISVFRGTVPCMILCSFTYFIRFFILSFVSNPWLVLPIQALNCISFALFWSAALEQTRQTSPPKISTTMFSILNVIHFALGPLIGNMLGGYLYDELGGRYFLRYSSFLFLFWPIFLLAAWLCCKGSLITNVTIQSDKNKTNTDITLNVIENNNIEMKTTESNIDGGEVLKQI